MPAPNKIVYEVYEATNGYFASLPSGKVVVGKTLAEVTTDANALVTEEMTAGMNAPDKQPLEELLRWQKGLLDAASVPTKFARFLK